MDALQQLPGAQRTVLPSHGLVGQKPSPPQARLLLQLALQAPALQQLAPVPPSLHSCKGGLLALLALQLVPHCPVAVLHA